MYLIIGFLCMVSGFIGLFTSKNLDSFIYNKPDKTNHPDKEDCLKDIVKENPYKKMFAYVGIILILISVIFFFKASQTNINIIISGSDVYISNQGFSFTLTQTKENQCHVPLSLSD